MNRYDERPPQFWRHEREYDRDEHRPRDEWRGRGDSSGRADWRAQGSRSGEDWRGAEDWRAREYSRGPDGWRWSERQPRSESRDRGSWSQHPYGQREPYNARDDSQRSRWAGRPGAARNDDSSRYSESQYGMGHRRSRYDPYASEAEPEFGEGPFADTSESPGYFGSGNYGDGGTSFTGGFDQRSRTRYPGSLGVDPFDSNERREEQRRYRTGPKGYTRSDERIREDISERLMMADSIDSSEVTVSVKDGRVTLEGTVPTRSMKHSIEDLADYTAGVQDVENRIRVERPGTPSVAPTAVSAKTTKQ
jgi:osmotically-inducible protein OsmY